MKKITKKYIFLLHNAKISPFYPPSVSHKCSNFVASTTGSAQNNTLRGWDMCISYSLRSRNLIKSYWLFALALGTP